MFTIILGGNPITMVCVDRGPANILRALNETILLIERRLLTQAIDNNGVFDKVAHWGAQQVETFSLATGSIKQALDALLEPLDWTDLFNVFKYDELWEGAKHILTEPIDRFKNFASELVTDIVKFIKDAILVPLAELAQNRVTGWDLPTAVLGKNLITDEEVRRNPETLIGGSMKLIHQKGVWKNMKKADTVDCEWEWFQGAMKELQGFVWKIPELAKNDFEALALEDIVVVTTAFEKVGVGFW